MPHPAQGASIKFINYANTLLTGDENLKLEIHWSPGHSDIDGNERADVLAKQGAASLDLAPLVGPTISYYREQSKTRAHESWVSEWELGNPKPNLAAVATRRPPSTRASKFLREFNGSVEITSRTIRALTGHAFMGEYYRRFVPTERVKCPCGHRIQTRDHIIMDCVLHENARHHLRKVTRSLSIPIILGTDKGLTAFAKFLANTDAFSKLFEAAT